MFFPQNTFKLILNAITEANECDLGHYIKKNVQLHREKARLVWLRNEKTIYDQTSEKLLQCMQKWSGKSMAFVTYFSTKA